MENAITLKAYQESVLTGKFPSHADRSVDIEAEIPLFYEESAEEVAQRIISNDLDLRQAVRFMEYTPINNDIRLVIKTFSNSLTEDFGNDTLRSFINICNKLNDNTYTAQNKFLSIHLKLFEFENGKLANGHWNISELTDFLVNFSQVFKISIGTAIEVALNIVKPGEMREILKESISTKGLNQKNTKGSSKPAQK